jgi:hypothetical protein
MVKQTFCSARKSVLSLLQGRETSFDIPLWDEFLRGFRGEARGVKRRILVTWTYLLEESPGRGEDRGVEEVFARR